MMSSIQIGRTLLLLMYISRLVKECSAFVSVLQVTFMAVAPLDRQEECAISLTGETRKLTVVGNIPELGEWSLKKGITLKQLKSGQHPFSQQFSANPVFTKAIHNTSFQVKASKSMKIIRTECSFSCVLPSNLLAFRHSHNRNGCKSFLPADEKEVVWHSDPVQIASERSASIHCVPQICQNGINSLLHPHTCPFVLHFLRQ